MTVLDRTIVDACPARARLAAYNLGALRADEIFEVASHVEGCPKCLQILRDLDDRADPLVQSLARLRPGAASTSIDQERIVARLTGICGDATEQQRPRPQQPMPEQIGPYEILQPLAEGGMGAVYKARHRHLGKIVALKLMNAARGGDDRSVARFILEMKALGQLSHPNIVQAHDAGIEVVPYLAMEFLEGMDLARYVKEHGPLSVPQACECVRQAAQALQYASNAGLVHRDVKPSNLLLTPEGCVKLLDLGLARMDADVSAGPDQAPADGAITATGAVMGTIDFISPEQLMDSRGVDRRADLYSLGCTLYYLLTGMPPFARTWDGNVGKRRAHLEDAPPNVRLLRPEVPADLGVVLERLLAKNPGYRFETPGELYTALEPYAAGCTLRGLTAPADGITGLGADSITADAPGLASSQSSSRWRAPTPNRQSHPMAWTIVAVVFLLLLSLGIGFVALRRSRDGKDVLGAGAKPASLIEAFDVEHFRSQDRRFVPMGPIGSKDAVRKGQDYFRVTARLTEPAHLYLIAYLPDGRHMVCLPDQDPGAATSRSVVYPRQGFMPLKEPGMHALVLVASRTPLPPIERWRIAPISWSPQAQSAAGAWKFDGSSFAPIPRDLTAPVPRGARELCELLAERPEVDAVQAIAFCVLADQAPPAKNDAPPP